MKPNTKMVKQQVNQQDVIKMEIYVGKKNKNMNLVLALLPTGNLYLMKNTMKNTHK